MSFVRLINLVLTLYSLAIIARSLLSLVRVNPYHPVMEFLIRITEPVLGPIRQIIPPIGPIDISPLVANSGIGAQDIVFVNENLLSCQDPTTQEHLAALESRGVDLSHDCD